LAHRIHIFGASGSGTTTLGRELARQLNGAHLDTDNYYWHKTDPPFVDKRDPEERVQLIQRDSAGEENWVLSGSICSWGDSLLESFTLAVFVQLDAEIRIQRLAQREKERYGNRINPDGDMHQIHNDFMDWAKSYDTASAPTRSLELHQTWLKKLSCPVVCANSITPCESLATDILENHTRDKSYKPANILRFRKQ